MLKILHARLQQNVNWELPDVQADFRKGRGTRDQIAICWIIKKAREFQKNIYFCFIEYAKALCGSQQTGKFWKRWEYQTTCPASWEICMQVRKQQLELDMEQQTGSKSVKEYIKAVYWDTSRGQWKDKSKEMLKSAWRQWRIWRTSVWRTLHGKMSQSLVAAWLALIPSLKPQSILSTLLSREDCWPLTPAKLCMVQKSHAYYNCRHLSIQKKHSILGVCVWRKVTKSIVNYCFILPTHPKI